MDLVGENIEVDSTQVELLTFLARAASMRGRSIARRNDLDRTGSAGILPVRGQGDEVPPF